MPTSWLLWTGVVEQLDDAGDKTEIAAKRKHGGFFNSLPVVAPTPKTDEDAMKEVNVAVAMEFLIK